MATHSNILAWGIPLTEEPGGLQSTGLQRVRQDWEANTHTHTHTHTHRVNMIKMKICKEVSHLLHLGFSRTPVGVLFVAGALLAF